MKIKTILVSSLLLLVTAISLRALPMERTGENDEGARLQPRSSSTIGEHADAASDMSEQGGVLSARSTTLLAVSEHGQFDEDASIAVSAEEIPLAMPYVGVNQNEARLPSALVSPEHIVPFNAEFEMAVPSHISIQTLVDMGANAETIREVG